MPKDLSLRGESVSTLPLEHGSIRKGSPTHDLLENIFKGLSWKTLGENVSQLLQSTNLQEQNPTLVYLLTKPNSLGSVILAVRCELRRQSLSQN